MTRSPLAYPLNRTADMDAGGAADLQTDIMRFMAILSLCLVAIFALVQSIPLTPTRADVPPPPTVSEPAEPLPVDPMPVEPVPVEPVKAEPVLVAAAPAAAEPQAPAITLTRPKWVPKFVPGNIAAPPTRPVDEAPPTHSAPEVPPVATVVEPVPPAVTEKEGFTLRFESDSALTRLVATSRVGLYAIDSNRAQRMTVSESRISFWDASTPNSFHEMEVATVPGPVLDALARTGTPTDVVSWGVTLPVKLKSQLDSLMHEHRGGALIIGASGDIRWEAS